MLAYDLPRLPMFGNNFLEIEVGPIISSYEYDMYVPLNINSLGG